MKIRPFRALRALGTLAFDPYDTKAGSQVVGALTGDSWERHAQEMRSDADGFDLLKDRPDLGAMLSRREWLASLPNGSLGRAYLRWSDDRGFNPAQMRTSLGARQTGLSDADYLLDRANISHDLWHIVTGYGTDLRGEAAVTHLMLFQYRHTGMILASFVAGAFQGWKLRRRVRALSDTCQWLPPVRWEELLELPLNRVRSRLQIKPERLN